MAQTDLVEQILALPPHLREELIERRLSDDQRAQIAELMRLRRAADRYGHAPNVFVRDVIGDILWSKQQEILDSVADNPRTIVPASHGVGKSFLAARAVAWWVESKEQPLVVTSAPSFTQVKTILWRELQRAHRAGGLSGRCNLTDWVRDKEIVAFGRKPAENAAEQVFQGVHSTNLLVVLDEAGGIPAWLWDEADKLMTNKNSRLLAIGNPDVEGSIFHQQTLDPENNVITISAQDSPNFTGEELPMEVLEELVTKDWVSNQARKFGVDSAVYARRVLAKFVVDATDGTIPRSWMFENRRESTGVVDGTPYITVGIDVGAGGDLTSMRAVYGKVAGEESSFRERDPIIQANRCADWCRAIGANRVNLDRIGVGHHLVGHLQEKLGDSVEVVGVSVAERSSDVENYPLVRDEMWWTAREKIRARDWDLHNVDDETIEQLASVRYKENSKHQIKIELKAEVIKRIGVSPDKAEALLLAYWEDESWTQEEATSHTYAQAAVEATGQVASMSTAMRRRGSPYDQ